MATDKIGMDATTRRMYLIAQLDGHYGRWLRNRIIFGYEDAKKQLEQMTDDFADRRVAVKHFITWMEEYVDLAREGAEALEAARQCPDEYLDDLVRWQTNPNWREAMTKAGMVFDTKKMHWVKS